MSVVLVKGMRVLVGGLIPTLGVVAGAQPKFCATEIGMTGTVVHIRGDAPTFEESKTVEVWLVPDDPEDARLFAGTALDIRYVRCEKCGRDEFGPIDVKLIKAVVE